MKPRTRRLLAAGIVAALVLGGGTAAFAYWTTTGHGAGTSATAGTVAAFTVSSTAPTGGLLTPGGVTDSATFTVTNPGTGYQKATTITAAIANSDGTTWAPASSTCSASDFTVNTPTFTASDIAPSGTATGTVTFTMKDTGVSQNSCQGLTVPLYFTVA